MTLSDTTWEQRRSMTAAELIAHMGELWIGHAAYKHRPGSNVRVPNLAGRQPVIEAHDASMFGQWRGFLRWAVA
jgi:hypothetical protein